MAVQGARRIGYQFAGHRFIGHWEVPMCLTYAIKFVADMDKAVAFHRDVLGLPLKFASPGWSEFATGETTLALHEASDRNPAGKVELGFGVDDLAGLYERREAAGLAFTGPLRAEHGTTLGQFLDSEGVACSISG
jgi:catechol 2,3-dioxygenase-like lactoylglutathione lyase family enzyme